MSGVVKKWAVFSAVWLVVLIIGTFLYVRVTVEDDFSAQNHVSKSSDYFYITDNGVNEGILYQMDEDGVASYFHSAKLPYLSGYRILLSAVYEEDPYAVFYREKDDGGREITEYAVVSFNTEMEPTSITAPFRFELPVSLSGFSVTEDRLYFTGISENRRTAYVYALSTSQLSEISTTALSKEDVAKWENTSADVTEVTSQGSEGNRYYGNASYEDGAIVTRMDNELAGEFAYDSEAASIYKNKKMTPALYLLKAGVSATTVLMLLICGVALIFVLCVLLRERKRIAYMIAIAETLLFLGFWGVYILYVANGRAALEKGYETLAYQSALSVFDGYELTDLSDATVYSASDYEVMANRLLRLLDIDYNGQLSTKSVTVSSMESTALLSSDGINQESLSEKYGTKAAELMSACISNASSKASWSTYQGKKALYVAVPLSKAGFNGCGALFVAVTDNTTLYVTSENQIMLLVLVILFVLTSVLCIVLLRGQHLDLAMLQDAISSLSKGETEIKKPIVIGKDMNYIWNSIFEIQKNILSISREKLLTYETYYRFAPKGIEKILGLSEVTEIKGNEQVNRKGTIATISVAGGLPLRDRDKQRFNELYEDLELYRNKYNGIFVSYTNDFALMKYLFLEEEKRTTEFGIDFIHKIRQLSDRDEDACMLLHYTPFTYGVMGVLEQASVYMTAPDAKYMDALSAWLLTMHLPLVITEDLLVHERPVASLRNIGFVTTESGGTVKLYEVLDALPASLRQVREDTLKSFSEALKLFYERDFYFARNTFSEILRKSPEDRVAKWYLFECEKYLDEAVPENYTGALHME